MSCLYMRSLSATTAHKLSKKSKKSKKRRGDRVSETCAECLAECSACVRSVRAESVRVRARARQGMGVMRSDLHRPSEGCGTVPRRARMLSGSGSPPCSFRPSVRHARRQRTPLV